MVVRPMSEYVEKIISNIMRQLELLKIYAESKDEAVRDRVRSSLKIVSNENNIVKFSDREF